MRVIHWCRRGTLRTLSRVAAVEHKRSVNLRVRSVNRRWTRG